MENENLDVLFKSNLVKEESNKYEYVNLNDILNEYNYDNTVDLFGLMNMNNQFQFNFNTILVLTYLYKKNTFYSHAD